MIPVQLRLDAAVLEDPAPLIPIVASILAVEAALEPLIEVQTGPPVLQALIQGGINLFGPIVPVGVRALGVMESTSLVSATPGSKKSSMESQMTRLSNTLGSISKSTKTFP